MPDNSKFLIGKILVKRHNDSFDKSIFSANGGKIEGVPGVIIPAIIDYLKKQKIVVNFSEVFNYLNYIHEAEPDNIIELDKRIKIYRPQINEELVKLISRFRWFGTNEGKRILFVVIGQGNMMVKLTDDPIFTAQMTTLKTKKGPISLYSYMEEQYINLRQQGLIPQRDPILLTEDEKLRLQSDEDAVIEKPNPESFKTYWETTLQELWELDNRFMLKEMPMAISDDPKAFCFLYFDKKSLEAHSEDPTPFWDKCLLKMAEPMREVFMAYVYSVFDAKHWGRQALWLYGPGKTGKSHMISAISSFLGDNNTAAFSREGIKTQFGLSAVFGKRLVISPDTDNPRLLQYEKVQSFLSGDFASVEFKGQTGFSARVYARMLVASNVKPLIDTNKIEQTSRVIAIEVGHGPDKDEYIREVKYIDKDGTERVSYEDRGKVNLKEELLREMQSFLFKCQHAYNKLSNGGSIQLNEKQLAVSRALFDTDDRDMYESFIHEYIYTHEDAKVSKGTLRAIFEVYISGKFTGKQHFDYINMVNGLKNLLRVKELQTRKLVIGEYGARQEFYMGFCIRDSICQHLNDIKDLRVKMAIEEIHNTWDTLKANEKEAKKEKQEEEDDYEDYQEEIKRVKKAKKVG